MRTPCRRERGLPIGFAMARLKLNLAFREVVRFVRLTDRIRDGAIETIEAEMEVDP